MGSKFGTVVWNLNLEDKSFSLPVASFSEDGDFLALTEQNRFWLCDLKQMRIVFAPPRSGVRAIGPTKFASSWVGVQAQDFAKVFDQVTGNALTPPLYHRARINAVTLSADGRLVATASDDKTARIWDADTGDAVTPPLQHSAPVAAVAFSADCRKLATLTGQDGRGVMWRLQPASGPVDDLEVLAKLYSARYIDSAVGLALMDRDQLKTVLASWHGASPFSAHGLDR